jgi:exopolysaccharide production protein ExoZ
MLSLRRSLSVISGQHASAGVPAPGPRLQYIDGLRGLAILGVLAVHCGLKIVDLSPPMRSATQFGALGVQLFFMLSALTLMTVRANRPFSHRDFFTRRFVRIAPAFYLAGVFYLVTSGLGPTHAAPHGLRLRHALLTALFIHGWWPDTINSVVPGGWSIGAEAMFYLSFPRIAQRVTTLGRAVGAVMVTFLLAAAWARLVPRLFVNYEPQYLIDDLIYFGFVWNLPAFMLGVLVFHLSSAVERRRRTTSYESAAQILLAVASILLVLASLGVQPLARRFVVVPMIAALVFAVGSTRTIVIDNRPMRFLGEISFGLYLVHFAVLDWFHTHLLHRLSFLSAEPRFGVLFAAVLGTSGAFAYVTWNVIERPAIELGRTLLTQRSVACESLAEDSSNSDRRPAP